MLAHVAKGIARAANSAPAARGALVFGQRTYHEKVTMFVTLGICNRKGLLIILIRGLLFDRLLNWCSGIPFNWLCGFTVWKK